MYIYIYVCVFWRISADVSCRYNTFYVLYPIGISCENILIWLALEPAGELHPLYRWFLIAVMVIYIPGMFAFVPYY